MPPPTIPESTHALFDGRTGEALTDDALPGLLGPADVVVFGELHGDLIGARYQLQLLRALHATGRPLALAMEFLERDVQATVDGYLHGDIDQPTFREQARQSKAYPATHGPLIEFCKANNIPVIAANAPRPLVTGYRKFDGDYEAYLASLTEAQRGQLPRTTSTPDDPYRDRFYKFMGPKRAPTFFRSQSLWDDAMAEAVTDFRDAHRGHRVLLVVGAFHVSHQGGTLTKIRARRPIDEVRSLVMDLAKPPFTFAPDDRGIGDIALKVPPPKRSPKP